MEHLKEVIVSCVRDEFGFKLTKPVQIKPDFDHDGDAIWMIDVWLTDGRKKIKRGDMIHLEGTIGRAVWREQRDDLQARGPIIRTHLPKKRAKAA